MSAPLYSLMMARSVLSIQLVALVIIAALFLRLPGKRLGGLCISGRSGSLVAECGFYDFSLAPAKSGTDKRACCLDICAG